VGVDTKELQSRKLEMDKINWLSVMIGASSIVIALCALVFSIWQGIQARRHNRLSVRPYLTSSMHNSEDNGIYSHAVYLENNGLGPALIDEFVMKCDGRIITLLAYDQIKRILKSLFPNSNCTPTAEYIANGYSISAKERIAILNIQFVVGYIMPSNEVLEDADNRIEIEVAYKSFYGEQFHYSSLEERKKQTRG